MGTDIHGNWGIERMFSLTAGLWDGTHSFMGGEKVFDAGHGTRSVLHSVS